MKPDFLKEFEFFTGVPDSLLKPFCETLTQACGTDPRRHIIAANEGNAVALAAGYHLATGKVPVVYLQNSGEGNILNPVASLMNDRVYGIPCVFLIGWRGEPDVHDEPQHIFQGEITLNLLRDMDIPYFVLDKETKEEDARARLEAWRPLLAAGKQVAFVAKKGTFSPDGTAQWQNGYSLRREEVIRAIVEVAGGDFLVSTTGKASRELFEIREARGEGHGHDFLTVGSMGHSSSIALGIALQKPDKRVWILDGDGAMLMHMGSMAIMGTTAPPNVIHVVLNNGAHESVGGMPTAASRLDLPMIARGCGYPDAVSVSDAAALGRELTAAKNRRSLSFLEVKCAIGSRADLGRPTTTARENKERFMECLAAK